MATGPLILANAWGGAWAAAWAGAWGNDWGQFTAEIYIAPAGNTRRNKVKAKVLAPVFAPTAKRWGVEEDEALLMACM